ncbi:MAG: PdxA family protein [Acidimicrobiia bacterium]
MIAQSKPLVAIMIGDPAGIGPEVIAKAIATGLPHAVSRPVLVGHAPAMEWAVEISGVDLVVRRIEHVDDAGLDPSVIDIIDDGDLEPGSYRLGEASAACGNASFAWLDRLDQMARSGQVAATIMAPINADSLRLSNQRRPVFSIEQGSTYLTLLSGPLRIVHLTDHEPLRAVPELITRDAVVQAIEVIHERFSAWGVTDPSIAVSGFNAHAKGREEADRIAPAVEEAAARGIDVVGPISPDTVFRHCIDGRNDVVLAMYHDQGHIAVKTWGFVGNCAMILGLPYLQFSVGHGTAFDIVGQNLARHEMILSAMTEAASLAAGRGFRPVGPTPA